MSIFPFEAEISLTLTDNEGIWKVNKEFREIDRPTDVLSFPMLEYDVPGDFSQIENQTEDCFNPDTGEILLGILLFLWTRSGNRQRNMVTAYKENLHF